MSTNTLADNQSFIAQIFPQHQDPYFRFMASTKSMFTMFDEGLLIIEALNRCESAIEKQLLTALYTGAICFHNTSLVVNGKQQAELDRGTPGLFIEPQFKIDRFRADFLVTHSNGTIKKSVVVECDGHEFHERTKEQAKRDRSKDRRIQDLGFKIFRFTGSEIYSNPDRCVQEIFRSIDAAYFESEA
jgi:very-short-patch-repair endonuclease